MRSVITALVIALAILAGGICYTNGVDSLSKQMEDINGEITAALGDDDFEAAEKKSEFLEDFIKKHHAALASVMDHGELDEIETNITSLKRYIKETERTEALACADILHMLFEHLPKNYRIKVENIL